MFKIFAAVIAVTLAVPSLAAIQPFPDSFRTEMLETNGTRLYARVGGMGPPWCYCVGLQIPETCGRRSPRSS